MLRPCCTHAGGVPWASLAAAGGPQAAGLRGLVARMLSLLSQVTEVVVPPLAAPLAGVGAEDVDGGEMEGAGESWLLVVALILDVGSYYEALVELWS